MQDVLQNVRLLSTTSSEEVERGGELMDLFTSIFGGGGAGQTHDHRQDGFFDGVQNLCGVRDRKKENFD